MQPRYGSYFVMCQGGLGKIFSFLQGLNGIVTRRSLRLRGLCFDDTSFCSASVLRLSGNFKASFQVKIVRDLVWWLQVKPLSDCSVRKFSMLSDILLERPLPRLMQAYNLILHPPIRLSVVFIVNCILIVIAERFPVQIPVQVSFPSCCTLRQ